MFEECVIRERRFVPARFCAPLAGYTHCAFRRLVSDFGGCGAMWTEMLAARQILHEDFATSTWLRRRPQEEGTVFQLMFRAGDAVEKILDRLRAHGVEAVDLNLACDNAQVRAQAAGSGLFDQPNEMRRIVEDARRHWPGLLMAKIRLGTERPGWETVLGERLRMLEEDGVDAVTVHPRFFEDKFRRRARLELMPWLASLTRLPLIANGDLGSPAQVAEQADQLRPACAIMIGRMAVVRPWLFAAWDQSQPVSVDYAEIWRTMFRYILEDFVPTVALRRIKMFTKYYAANFAFGHPFYIAVFYAPSVDAVRQLGEAFFARNPATVSVPTVAGL